MRIAALVKQIPIVEDLHLGADGRLRRDTGPLEMSAYCRRAVAKGIELARETGGTCTAISLGPPAAQDVLREAVAAGADDGVLLCDLSFAGSDTIATAKALQAALRQLGPFDLVLTGRNSLDADTGQVGPSLAELLGWPFLAAVRAITLMPDARLLTTHCERDDGWLDAQVSLPAVLSCAERLCDPAKRSADARAEVAAERIRVITAADLGPGPWGVAASRTTVGEVRVTAATRTPRLLQGTLEAQAEQAAAAIAGYLHTTRDDAPQARSVAVADRALPASLTESVAVLIEPGRERCGRELLGAATLLTGPGGVVIAVAGPRLDPATASTWGADRLIQLTGSSLPHDLAAGYAGWLAGGRPWASLAPATLWGREILARVAARLDVGLTGDAVGLERIEDRLVAWKPAFGGRMVAAIRSTDDVQAVTVRPGVLPLPPLRDARPLTAELVKIGAAPGIRVLTTTVDNEPDRLAEAKVVIGVGTGVDAAGYADLDPLRDVLSAEICATRRVTDTGAMPHSRQVGITGQAISPLVYLAIGLSGKPNHMLATSGAGLIVAVNTDAGAPVFATADIGVVADWRQFLPLLISALRARVGART